MEPIDLLDDSPPAKAKSAETLIAVGNDPDLIESVEAVLDIAAQDAMMREHLAAESLLEETKETEEEFDILRQDLHQLFTATQESEHHKSAFLETPPTAAPAVQGNDFDNHIPVFLQALIDQVEQFKPRPNRLLKLQNRILIVNFHFTFCIKCFLGRYSWRKSYFDSKSISSSFAAYSIRKRVKICNSS